MCQTTPSVYTAYDIFVKYLDLRYTDVWFNLLKKCPLKICLTLNIFILSLDFNKRR